MQVAAQGTVHVREVIERPAIEPQKKAAGEQRGRPFRRGRSGNPRGRPKGVPNKATREVRQVARAIVDDAEYRRNLLNRIRARASWRQQLSRCSGTTPTASRRRPWPTRAESSCAGSSPARTRTRRRATPEDARLHSVLPPELGAAVSRRTAAVGGAGAPPTGGKTTAVLNHHQRAATDAAWEARRLRRLAPASSDGLPCRRSPVWARVRPRERQPRRVGSSTGRRCGPA